VNVDFILRGYVAEQTTPYTLDSKTSVYYYALLPAGTTYNVDVAETATGTDSNSSAVIFRVAVAETATGTDSGSSAAIFRVDVSETTAGLDASSADVIVSISFTPIVIFM
jgi:hypothetical protein